MSRHSFHFLQMGCRRCGRSRRTCSPRPRHAPATWAGRSASTCPASRSASALRYYAPAPVYYRTGPGVLRAAAAGLLPSGARLLRPAAPVYYGPPPWLLPSGCRATTARHGHGTATGAERQLTIACCHMEKPARRGRFFLGRRFVLHGAKQVGVEPADRDLLRAAAQASGAACRPRRGARDSIASLRTTTARCTCQKTSASSCGSSCLSGVRIRYSCVGGQHAHVLVGGFEVQHLVDRAPCARVLPTPASLAAISLSGAPRRRPAAAAGSGEQLAPLRERAGRAHRRPAAAGALRSASACCSRAHGAAQALGLHRLEHVVDRLGVEGARRVLVVGGHEHQLRHRRLVGRPVVGQFGGGAQAVQARHADVEEQHLRQQRAAPRAPRCGRRRRWRAICSSGQAAASSARRACASSGSSSAMRAVALSCVGKGKVMVAQRAAARRAALRVDRAAAAP